MIYGKEEDNVKISPRIEIAFKQLLINNLLAYAEDEIDEDQVELLEGLALNIEDEIATEDEILEAIEQIAL